MDDQSKPLNIKYALEHLKRLRDLSPQKYNEAGTSFIIPTPKEPPQRPPRQRQTEDNKNQRLALNRKSEYQHNLLDHPYTDVDQKLLTIMSKTNETKPLNQPQAATKLKSTPTYDVHRDVLTHELVIKKTGYVARDKSIPNAIRQCFTGCSFLGLFTGIIPILQWLPKYSLKRDLFGDIIAGFTVAIMHIPHGMAYGLLAGVSPGCGLYMAIFPVLVYMILGTSRHISIGTFAVASMMSLKVVQTYATEDSALATTPPDEVITPLQVVTALALTVGIIHVGMGIFGLGTLSSLLSDPLVNGFTTGAACHVVTSQLKDVLGVSVPRHKGAFKIIYTLIDLGKSVPNTNLAALIFCLSIMFFMIICNEVLKPLLQKRCRFPLPAELMAVIGGTLVSRFVNVNSLYGVQLVGNIPSGLPMPEFPPPSLIPLVAVDSIAIAFVTYSIVMSMGLTFAKKHNYEVRPNQELFAMGIGNIVGGCFSCIPLACSLSRSVIQDQTGGKTQIASLVSALLIIATLLWAGPFFSDLPRCVLAGVIIIALKPMFMQAKELKKFAKQGKLELLTWLCTFISVVLIDIDYGLLIGIAISLLALYIKGVKPYGSLLGYVPEAPAIYVDISQHHNAVEIPETKIFRYSGSLNFATNRSYRNALYRALGIGKKVPKRQQQYQQLDQQPQVQANGKPQIVSGMDATNANGALAPHDYRFLILDFSMLGHIDVAGCRTLSEIKRDMQARDVTLYLATPVDRVYDCLVHSMALGEGPFVIFPTLHDAVEYANAARMS